MKNVYNVTDVTPTRSTDPKHVKCLEMNLYEV